jgi:hypothetical protein
MTISPPPSARGYPAFSLTHQPAADSLLAA